MRCLYTTLRTDRAYLPVSMPTDQGGGHFLRSRMKSALDER